jgi:hypothetical protein
MEGVMGEALDGTSGVVRLGPFMTARLGSVRKATKVAGFIASWGIAYEALKLGGAITIDEYADYWNVSRAKAFRDYQLYKQVWPRDFSPLRVWKWCKVHGVVSRDADVAAAQIFNVKEMVV